MSNTPNYKNYVLNVSASYSNSDLHKGIVYPYILKNDKAHTKYMVN